jgi:hypothetical protein
LPFVRPDVPINTQPVGIVAENNDQFIVTSNNDEFLIPIEKIK